MLSAHHRVPIAGVRACGLVLCSRTELLTRTVLIVFACGYQKPTVWILDQWFLGNICVFSCMMRCRSGLITIPVLWWTQRDALGKLLIQELWIFIFWIILLALKAVVLTNNNTHSSGFMLTTSAVNNAQFSYSPCHHSSAFSLKCQEFAWWGDVLQLSHEWNWARFPPVPTWKDLANSMETNWRYKTAPGVVWSIPW